MKKKVAIIMMIIVLLLIFSILIFLKFKNSNKILDKYIAGFHGGYGEQTYETYSYVTLPNSDKTYTIEEYMDMFLMN